MPPVPARLPLAPAEAARVRPGRAALVIGFALGVLATGAVARTGSIPAPALPVLAGHVEVEQALARGALLWDVRDSRSFAGSHLPGARSVGDVTQRLRTADGEHLLAADEAAALLGEAGVDTTREVVVYGERASPAAWFAQQALRAWGVGRISVYHGGIDDWRAARRPLASGPAGAAAVRVALAAEPFRTIDTAGLRTRLNQPWVQILDVRSPAEFAAHDVRALRGGRVPGALNRPLPGGPGAPEADARERWQARLAGLDARKETIVYAHAPAEAAPAAAMLAALGFGQVRLYVGGWQAWGNTLDAPVEAPRYADVAALQDRIRSLQGILARFAHAFGRGEKVEHDRRAVEQVVAENVELGVPLQADRVAGAAPAYRFDDAVERAACVDHQVAAEPVDRLVMDARDAGRTGVFVQRAQP